MRVDERREGEEEKERERVGWSEITRDGWRSAVLATDSIFDSQQARRRVNERTEELSCLSLDLDYTQLYS